MDARKLSSDREQREYVPYARAMAHLELSVRSAEQAAASSAFLRRLAGIMPGMSRGVLRSAVGSSLKALLARLMAPPATATQTLHEWREFAASGGGGGASSAVDEWWAAYAAAYDAAAKWAKKPAHAPFCYDLMVAMVSHASSEASLGPGALGFVSPPRRERLLALPTSGCRRDTASRPVCLQLAASHIDHLPADCIRMSLGTGSGGGGGGGGGEGGGDGTAGSAGGGAGDLRALVSQILPRRYALRRRRPPTSAASSSGSRPRKTTRPSS